MGPLVSIIIPAYNHEKYINDCLMSIVNQSYDNLELLITDDCSIDKTFEKAVDFVNKNRERFKRVQINRNNKNSGVNRTLNQMITRAEGRYIKQIASDDLLLPNCISDLVNYCENNSEIGLVFSNGHKVDESFTYSNWQILDTGLIYRNDICLDKDIHQAVYEDNFICAPTVMLRREVFNRVGLYDEKLDIEDWDYWIRVTMRFKIGFLNVPTVLYRVSQSSLSHFSDNESGRARFVQMYKNQYAIIRKHESDPNLNCNRALANFYYRMINEAIDHRFDSELRDILLDMKKDNCKIKIEACGKLILYKFGLLDLAQSIKRRLGLETFQRI